MERLNQIGRGTGEIPDVAGSALILASLDRPGVSDQKYQHHLKILILDIAAEKINSGSAKDRAVALQNVLHHRHEYMGNEDFYDDLQNANLMSVIDTRKGLPASLAILYIHVARSQGWVIEALKFPGHLLLRLHGEDAARGGPVIIDPFYGGRIRNARDLRALVKETINAGANLKPDYYEAISDRDILVNLLHGIKIRCLKASDLGQAINILARLVMIDPRTIHHHYEMGMLLSHVGKYEQARVSLEYCLDHIEKLDKNDILELQIKNMLQDIDQHIKDQQMSNIHEIKQE